jgi:type II secretory pathway component PulL
MRPGLSRRPKRSAAHASVSNAYSPKYLLEETFYSPYALAGYSVVRQALEWAQRKKVRSPIEFVFEDGDEGWEGLKKLCARRQIVPIQLPKKKAVPCQIGDFVAWKYRIAATNSLRRLKSIEQSAAPDIADLQGIFNELESLNKMLVSPARPLVYSPQALERTCKKSNIPQRSKINPTPSI